MSDFTIVISIFHPKLCPYVYRIPRAFLTDKEYENLRLMQGLVVGRNTRGVNEIVISRLEEKLEAKNEYREFSNINIDGILYPDMKDKIIRVDTGAVEFFFYSHREITDEYDSDSDSSVELEVDVRALDIDVEKEM